jgi:hypothetical protein
MAGLKVWATTGATVSAVGTAPVTPGTATRLGPAELSVDAGAVAWGRVVTPAGSGAAEAGLAKAVMSANPTRIPAAAPSRMSADRWSVPCVRDGSPPNSVNSLSTVSTGTQLPLLVLIKPLKVMNIGTGEVDRL